MADCNDSTKQLLMNEIHGNLWHIYNAQDTKNKRVRQFATIAPSSDLTNSSMATSGIFMMHNTQKIRECGSVRRQNQAANNEDPLQPLAYL